MDIASTPHLHVYFGPKFYAFKDRQRDVAHAVYLDVRDQFPDWSYMPSVACQS